MSADRKPAGNAERGAARGRPPVSWHPLFPAFVAVWFGALFGLGVLAVRVSLLERLAVASGIDRIIPAAAPPLGVNARILIALALAALGGVIGAAIGCLIARSKPAARARRTAKAEAAAQAAAVRAANKVAAKTAAAAPEPAPAPAKAPAFADAPSFIDISQLDLDDEHRIEAERAIEAPPAPARGFERPLDPVSFPLPASFPVPGGAAAQRLTAADLDTLSHLELIERLALSLQKRREEASQEAAPAGEVAAPGSVPQAPAYYPPAREPLARALGALRDARPIVDDESDEADPRPVALFAATDASSVAAPKIAALRQNSVATERALRDALATLQRMSGAA